MKPRITMIAGWWMCLSSDRVGMAETPALAYHYWKYGKLLCLTGLVSSFTLKAP